jgi:hypothetical protein
MVADRCLPLTDVRFVASILAVTCEDRYGPLTMTLRSLVDLIEVTARR